MRSGRNAVTKSTKPEATEIATANEPSRSTGIAVTKPTSAHSTTAVSVATTYGKSQRDIVIATVYPPSTANAAWPIENTPA